jgi:uncharacterized protein YjbI with pentapeptide repeats
MITKGNRRNGQPIYVQNDLTKNLVRLPLNGKDFSNVKICGANLDLAQLDRCNF